MTSSSIFYLFLKQTAKSRFPISRYVEYLHIRIHTHLKKNFSFDQSTLKTLKTII